MLKITGCIILFHFYSFTSYHFSFLCSFCHFLSLIRSLLISTLIGLSMNIIGNNLNLFSFIYFFANLYFFNGILFRNYMFHVLFHFQILSYSFTIFHLINLLFIYCFIYIYYFVEFVILFIIVIVYLVLHYCDFQTALYGIVNPRFYSIPKKKKNFYF